ncbi:MAG TPA: hypothetical protein VJV76_07495 [Gaiellaceae bacterium]|nr:hypothetical protein [Gaiellaceae bacterium]
MAAKQQTHAKRARELALKERRERKRAKKEQTADERAAVREAAAQNGGTEAEEHSTPAPAEWIR